MAQALEKRYEGKSFVYPLYPSFFLVEKDYALSEKRVLDLGASDGRYTERFGKGSCGVEYGQIDREAAVKKGLEVVFGNLNEKDFNFFPGRNFDFIFASHVIEHLESPYNFIQSCGKIGDGKAGLILGYPIEKSLVRLFDPYFVHGHVYSFSLGNIKKLLGEAGYVIERTYFDLPFAGRWAPFRWLQRIVRPLPYWMVSWWASAVYVVAKKA